MLRDLPGIEALGLPIFAGNAAVSHAYAHIVDYGGAVEIGGLSIRPGELLHGDCHGILSIPLEIAAAIPAAAARLIAREQEVLAVSRTRKLSLEKLRTVTRRIFDEGESAPGPS